jgi:hypothetical protein
VLSARVGAWRADGRGAPLAHLVRFVEFLRTDAACRFTSLVDITAVDIPNGPRGSTWSITSCRCTGTTASA